MYIGALLGERDKMSLSGGVEREEGRKMGVGEKKKKHLTVCNG